MSTLVHSLPTARIRPSPSKLAHKLRTSLLWLLTAGLILVLILPVLLLFVFTGVPPLVTVALLFVDLALIVTLLKLDRSPVVVSGVLAGLVAVSILAVFLSQLLARTPPITDAQGKPLANSIAVLEKVTLNGSEQWITIRGKDVNNPVLLNLGMGGPGGGGFATRTLFEPLEEHFVVVSWDEPGTGKSYNAVPISSLTPQRFVDDAHALTQYLSERFHQDKIFVYGVSWTSILGIWLIQQHPGDYYAYIGTGQMVSTTENDVLGYELALNYSVERGDNASAETLRRNGPPPYTGEGLLAKYVTYLDILNDYMGEARYMIVAPIVPFLSPEYGLIDRVNHTRGLIDSFTFVYPQLANLDFTSQANKLDVPVYLFVGRQDVNAMSSLVERYFNVLQAPHKELIWLDGGHGLDGSNRAQFTEVMVNKVLADNMLAPR